ncbi:MAG: DUF4397 domain-containing protein, partial [Planctomycetota bacterium]
RRDPNPYARSSGQTTQENTMQLTKIGAVLTAASAVSLLATPAAADVRVAHLSPNTPTVDVLAGLSGQSKGLLFDAASYPSITPYLPVPTGTYDIDVVLDSDNSVVGIDVDNFAIDADTDYTIAAVGLLGGDPALQALPLVDDNTIDESNARVRFVHASSNAPTVDIDAVGVGTVFDDVDRFTSGGYISVPGGTYDFDVFLSDDRDAGSVLDLDGIVLDNGTVYTVYAIGLVGDVDTPLGATISVDAVIPEPASLGLLSAGGLLLMRRRRA